MLILIRRRRGWASTLKQTGSGGCRTGSPQSNTNNIHIFGLKKYIYIIYIVLSFGLKYLITELFADLGYGSGAGGFCTNGRTLLTKTYVGVFLNMAMLIFFLNKCTKYTFSRDFTTNFDQFEMCSISPDSLGDRQENENGRWCVKSWHGKTVTREMQQSQRFQNIVWGRSPLTCL